MLTKEQEVEIGVLAKQGRSQRAIAREMGVSRNTVKKILEAPREARKYGPRPPVDSKLEPFKTYLNERVAAAAPQWIPATVLHREITERGFDGVYETTKRYLRKLKAAKVIEPVVRFETDPGEQMQFDWATMRRGRDRLVVFIATMGWSRASYVRFATDETIETLITSLYGAFDYFGGVPKTALTDNMKVVVDQRDAYGTGLHRYNRVFLDFAGHCGFAPRLCQPYRAKTKGKVERFVRYLRVCQEFRVRAGHTTAPDHMLQTRLENFLTPRGRPHTSRSAELIAYSVKRKADGGSAWIRIGAAFPHDQGAGLTVVLDAVPLDNRIVLLEPRQN